MGLCMYWWSRFGSYSPGLYNLPHMGEVIADYRRRRYRTQDDFAIAIDVEKRTVQEWETATVTADIGRRILLSRMLKIPPALLGLDWHQIADDDITGTHIDSFSNMIERIEEDAYYAYEDILVMGHEYIHNGGSIDTAHRVNRRLRKLVHITKNARATDSDAWKTLLCRYYQLSTRIQQQCLANEQAATEHARLAIQLAKDVDDGELIASAFVNSACTNTQQKKMKEAQQDIAVALDYVDKVRNGPLKGNIYLESANINTPLAINDKKLQDQCKTWQNFAANMLYKGVIEPDESFFHFNLSAVNHEKARSLLHWQKSKEDRKGVQSKLKTAMETLSPDLTVWQSYYLVTEAQLYLADHDIEASAKSAKLALKVARSMHSKMGEENSKDIYYTLYKESQNNPYVANLGLELGIF